MINKNQRLSKYGGAITIEMSHNHLILLKLSQDQQPIKLLSVNKYNIYNEDNLLSDTDYNIYVVPGSAHPGYPDLPADSQVLLIPCHT